MAENLNSEQTLATHKRSSIDFFQDYNTYIEDLVSSSGITETFKKLLEAAKDLSKKLNKDQISLSFSESYLMANFIKQYHFEKFVEVGTLTGYSSLWIAQALAENSEIWTFEKDEKHYKAASEVFAKAKVIFPNKKINLLLGDAEEEIIKIESDGPFDGIFIDGNKSAYLNYLDWAEKNIKKGGLIIADNVFLKGSVWGVEETNFSKKQTAIMQEFNKKLMNTEKYLSFILPTSEGMSVSIKLF